jgi:hypothetical protein
MIVLAFITDPGVVRKILDHLGLPSADPPRGPSRFERREEQVEMFEGWEEEGEARAFTKCEMASAREGRKIRHDGRNMMTFLRAL